MSDSEEDTPQLIADDTEDGEVLDDESGYYGWFASPEPQYQGRYVDDDYNGGGTVREYQPQEGFGRSRGAPSGIPHQEPQYLGVGETFYDPYDYGDQIQIFQEGEETSQSGEDFDFEGVEEVEEAPLGGPSDFDLELDEVGTIPLDQEKGNKQPKSTPNISVLPPSFFSPPSQPLAPSNEQIKQLMKVAESHRPQGQKAKLVNTDSHISAASNEKPPLPDPQGSMPKVAFNANGFRPSPGAANGTIVNPGLKLVATQPNFAQGAPPPQRQVVVPGYQVTPNHQVNHMVSQPPPLPVPVPNTPSNVDPSTGINFHPLVKNYHIKVKEETSPPIEESLAFIINDYFSRACTDVTSLEIKDAYESLLRPANTQHLIKTELNPEFKIPKVGISKSGILKDGHARGVQNSHKTSCITGTNSK